MTPADAPQLLSQQGNKMRPRVFAPEMRVVTQPMAAHPAPDEKPHDWDEKWMSVTS